MLTRCVVEGMQKTIDKDKDKDKAGVGGGEMYVPIVYVCVDTEIAIEWAMDEAIVHPGAER